MVLGSGIRDPEKTYSGSRIQGSKKQGCGSGSVLDPYSMGSVDPDPDP